MERDELASEVDRVVEAAGRLFGGRADDRLIEQYAREAALDLWLTRPRLTVSLAERARRRASAALLADAAAHIPQAA